MVKWTILVHNFNNMNCIRRLSANNFFKGDTTIFILERKFSNCLCMQVAATELLPLEETNNKSTATRTKINRYVKLITSNKQPFIQKKIRAITMMAQNCSQKFTKISAKNTQQNNKSTS